MKTFLKILVPFLLGAVVALFGIYSINNLQIFDDGDTKINVTVIKNSFGDIAELTTQEYEFSDMGKYEQENKKLIGDLRIPFTGKYFVISYDGVVKAGIRDITQAKVELNDITRILTVTLPDVEILDAYTDPASYETLDETFNPFNQITPGDVAELLKAELDTHVEQAKADGLLTSAREHAEQVVQAHVKALLTGTDLENCTVNVVWAK